MRASVISKGSALIQLCVDRCIPILLPLSLVRRSGRTTSLFREGIEQQKHPHKGAPSSPPLTKPRNSTAVCSLAPPLIWYYQSQIGRHAANACDGQGG